MYVCMYVCTSMMYVCTSMMYVLEFILGIWNSNYIVWKITQAYDSEWHTFFVQRFRVLVSSSQVQGNSSSWVRLYSFSSLPSASRTPSLVVSWPLPLYISFNPSAPSFPTWVESCRHLLGKYTFDVYFLPFTPPYFNICYVMYIGVPFAINAWEFSLGDRSQWDWSGSWVWAALLCWQAPIWLVVKIHVLWCLCTVLVYELNTYMTGENRLLDEWCALSCFLYVFLHD